MAVNRAEASRRLKAARWLCGSVKANGQPKELSVADLAQMVGDRVTANRIREIEQGKTEPRMSELRRIAEVLELPGWFEGLEIGLSPALAATLLRRLADAADREHRQGAEGPPSEPGDTDHPGQAEGDTGA